MASLWKVMREFGCSDEHLYERAKARLAVGNLESEQIEVVHRTKQGCLLALTFFHTFYDNRPYADAPGN